MAGDIPVFCAFDKIVPVEEMRPKPKNPNRHPEDQVELLAKVIEAQGWRQPVKVSTRSGLIVSGHGRYQAALLLGCPVPVDFQEYPSEAEELADLLADNRIAELAEMDNAKLAELFATVDDLGLDVELTGYDSDFMDALNALGHEIEADAAEESEYTQKVEAPLYQVTGETPEVGDLFDNVRALELIQDIEGAQDISQEEKEFLKLAASRHIVFDFRNIAEYYAAAGATMQGLMEDSALVVIDFGRAIELGYCKLKKELAEAAESEGVEV